MIWIEICFCLIIHFFINIICTLTYIRINIRSSAILWLDYALNFVHQSINRLTSRNFDRNYAPTVLFRGRSFSSLYLTIINKHSYIFIRASISRKRPDESIDVARDNAPRRKPNALIESFCVSFMPTAPTNLTADYASRHWTET